MRPLIITEDARAAIRAVVEYAEAHPITPDEIGIPVGDSAPHVCTVPVDFRCAFSIDRHPEGDARHLSVSVPDPRRVPHPVALEMLAEAFGFRPLTDNDPIWPEETPTGHIALNVLQFINPLAAYDILARPSLS